MLKGPLSGIPYKIYATLAPKYMSPATFLCFSIPARLERLALTWLLFGFFGLLFRQSLPVFRGIGHLTYWIIVYILYWSAI